MTTIEHLAIINLRLARKCAKKDDFIEGMKRTVAAHIAKSSEMDRQRAAAEAKLADAKATRDKALEIQTAKVRMLSEDCGKAVAETQRARNDAETAKAFRNQADRLRSKAEENEREALAKLADAERRLRDANNDRLYHCAYCGETGDMSAIADHSKVCAKHPMREVERERDAEKARADALQTTEAEIRHLRAEVERLQVAIGKEHTDNERLRGIIGRALDRLSDILCGPDDKCRIDGSPADRAIVDDALRELREADAPPKRHLPADHKCVLCHGTGYYGDNGPGIKGNSEYQPCGCTMREADAPPAKPRDSTGRDASAVAAMLPPKPRRMKANPKHSCEGNPYHGTEHDELASCVTIYLCEPVDATDAKEARP